MASRNAGTYLLFGFRGRFHQGRTQPPLQPCIKQASNTPAPTRSKHRIATENEAQNHAQAKQIVALPDKQAQPGAQPEGLRGLGKTGAPPFKQTAVQDKVRSIFSRPLPVAHGPASYNRVVIPGRLYSTGPLLPRAWPQQYTQTQAHECTDCGAEVSVWSAKPAAKAYPRAFPLNSF